MATVVVVHPHFAYPGGAGQVALHTADGLAKRGHVVHVLSMANPPDLERAWPAVIFHQLGGPLTSSLAYWVTLPHQHERIFARIRELDPDVLIAHVFPANYWAFTLRRSSSRPRIVWYCHEPSAFVHDHKVINGVTWPMRLAVWAANPFLQIVDRRLVRRADAVLTNSAFTSERVRKIYGRNADVAYPGYDPPPVVPPPANQLRILSIGRLTKFKRFDLVILAAKELKNRGFQIEWVIVGDGEERGKLERLVSECRVGDCVRLVGRVSDQELENLYHSCLAVVVCSIDEPLGLVAVDALARQRAVICSDSGGLRESVEDGISGRMFRPGDWLDLADKVEGIVLDPQLAVEMGKAGNLRIASRFNWSSTVDHIEAAFGM